MERRVNSDEKTAKKFAKILSRTPIIPIAVASAGLAIDNMLNTPPAYATHDGTAKNCTISIEIYGPRFDNENVYVDGLVLPRPALEKIQLPTHERVLLDKREIPIACSNTSDISVISFNPSEKGSIKEDFRFPFTHTLLLGGVALLALVAGSTGWITQGKDRERIK